MSDNGWTPGPWAVGVSDHEELPCVDAQNGDSAIEVCVCWGELNAYVADEQSRANANLISQAPTMYNTLWDAPDPDKYFGADGFKYELFMTHYMIWLLEARAVMAQARGETK